VSGEVLLDLCYEEDSRAAVDMNLVMTSGGRAIEVQASAEAMPYTLEQLQQLLALGKSGIDLLVGLQKEALAGIGPY